MYQHLKWNFDSVAHPTHWNPDSADHDEGKWLDRCGSFVQGQGGSVASYGHGDDAAVSNGSDVSTVDNVKLIFLQDVLAVFRQAVHHLRVGSLAEVEQGACRRLQVVANRLRVDGARAKEIDPPVPGPSSNIVAARLQPTDRLTRSVPNQFHAFTTVNWVVGMQRRWK